MGGFEREIKVFSSVGEEAYVRHKDEMFKATFTLVPPKENILRDKIILKHFDNVPNLTLSDNFY